MPGPSPATGPEQMPELESVRSNSDGTKPRAAHKAAHGVLDQVPTWAGTPDDLNDSIWTIGPNKRSGIRHAWHGTAWAARFS